ncbi:hypothetical protein BZG36_01372 [Bifiguratus adelaidae]|uniref:Vacuolar protein sorting-associated protein 54 n=1 Tax=Bifiguratus adelaidae TaxID=1938954 RepID=A0A261Y3B2_9FUNG|nr:hypothetical protein BZG36_01372 [Bifiguratus adelaidae]
MESGSVSPPKTSSGPTSTESLPLTTASPDAAFASASSEDIPQELPSRGHVRSPSLRHSRPTSIRASTTQRPWSKIYGSEHARRSSNFLNFSTLSEASVPWTTKDIGFNAISGVLNDPANRSSNIPRPTKNDIPPTPHVAIPRVRSSEFDAYIKHITPVFERYATNKNLRASATSLQEDGNESSLSRPLGGGSPEPQKQQVSGRNPYGVPTIPTSSLSDLSISTSHSKPDSEEDLPMIELVPSIFFEESFNLENPRTFDAVCEGADVVGDKNGTKAAETNTILQEKLSQYLDTVEVHLTREISKRSSSFFEALYNLQSLHQETVGCVAQIDSIRRRMKRLHQSQCKQGLEVVRLKRRQANVSALADAVASIKQIRSSVPMIQLMLGQRDYFGALFLIEESKVALEEGAFHSRSNGGYTTSDNADDESTKAVVSRRSPVDLSSVRVMLSFGPQLSDLQKNIAMMMEADLLTILMNDLETTVAKFAIKPAVQLLLVSSKAGLDDAVKAAPRDSQDQTNVMSDLSEKIIPLIAGLLKTQRMSVTLQLYRERLLVFVKEIARKQYPSYMDGLPDIDQTLDPNSVPPGTNLQSPIIRMFKSMSFDTFFDQVLSIYAVLLEVTREIALQHQVLVVIFEQLRKTSASEELIGQIGTDIGNNARIQKDVAQAESEDPDLPAEPSSDVAKENITAITNQFIVEAADILFTAVDATHVRCSKLIAIRTDQNAQLNHTDFYRLNHVSWTFIASGEEQCGKVCYGLRGALLNQAKAFLTNFHMEKLKQESSLIENEQWEFIEVPSDFQNIADRLIAQGTAKEFTNGTHEPANGDSRDKRDSSKFLVINGQSYWMVGCSLLLIKTLEEYVQCVSNLQSIGADVMHKLIEMLKMVNSRICQVILGAGAMRSAGLKNISAKHIALGSQSLGAIMALIPFIKRCFQQHMPEKQTVLLVDFDKVLNDFQEHQRELHAKLVSIMQDFLELNCKAFALIDWDKEPTPTKGASEYMERIVQQNVRLHKVLAKYLPSADTQAIMQEVSKVYVARLIEEIGEVKISTSDGKERLLLDMRFFGRRLAAYDGYKDIESKLESAVADLTVEQ